MTAPADAAEPTPAVQSDYEKLRRVPYFYGYTVLTSMAILCTVQAPLTLFAEELGLGEDRIGLLGGIMPFFQALGLVALPVIARFGARRVAPLALLMRYACLALFFLTPVFAGSPDAVFAVLLTAMIGFAVMRAVAEAGFIPWSQEFLPRAVRGRIAGRNAMIYVPVALVVSWLIQRWLDGNTGLWRFYPVFAVGMAVGVLGALSLFGLRGGAPEPRTGPARRGFRSLGEPLRDRNFLVFLYSAAVQYLVFTALNVFLLVFFRQRLGISSGTLVFMAAFVPVGAAFGTFISGWLVDRYGARPVRITQIAGQVVLFLALPFLGGGVGAEEVVVATVFFLFGAFVQSGIAVGNVYMLNTIPPGAKEAFTSVHYAVVGLVGGGVTFLAGVLLAWLATTPLSLFGWPVGNFEVLFLIAALLSATEAVAFHFLREEGGISMRDFVGHFSSGATMRALWSIQRYAGPTSEDRRRELAYGFGSTGSPLTRQELIEALRDPSFDVRHEAVQSLGHLAPHAEVTGALERVLRFDGLVELQYAALESLGRLRATESAPPVARFLDDQNPLLRARAIRSLGEMRHAASLAPARRMLDSDPELDCRLAAVSALGKYRDRDSMEGLMAIYRDQAQSADPMAEPRSKVVLLALSKILGCEESFSQVWRNEQRNPGHAMPDLLMRLAVTARAAPGGRAEGAALRKMVARLGPDTYGAAFARLSGLRPLVAQSRHPDAPLSLRLIDGLGDIAKPHPALLILSSLSIRRVLRR